jgi:putative endonuclease
MANLHRTIYIGVTNDLLRRVDQHKKKLLPGFTARYGLTKLVYYEETDDVRSALEREKHLKGWTRRRKVALIELVNPEWQDLTEQ